MKYAIDAIEEVLPYIFLTVLAFLLCVIVDNIVIIKNQLKKITEATDTCITINNRKYCEINER